MRRARVLSGAILVASLASTGCAAAPERDAVAEVVAAYYDAVGDGRGGRACALLSQATIEALENQESRPCREAITGLDQRGGRIVAVHAFITSAKVDLASGESVFLDREPGGWRLSALACRVEDGQPRDRPLECDVEA